MTKLETFLLFVLQLFAYIIVAVIAIASYVVIGIIYCVFPVYVIYVLLKSLCGKTCGKLASVFKR